METPPPVQGMGNPQPCVDGKAEVEIDVSSPSRDELLEIMSGLMIDYNAMTKCLEETTEALASAEEQASSAQKENDNLKAETQSLHEEVQEVRQQLSMKDCELDDCRIKLRWAQQSPRPVEDKSGFVTLSAMNEQLQIAATQGLREKQQREGLQREVNQLKQALQESKLKSKELQDRLTQRSQQCLVDEQQKKEIKYARNRLTANWHRARQEKPRGTTAVPYAQHSSSGQTPQTAGSPVTDKGHETDVCTQMTPHFKDAGEACEPLCPVASDTSMPANSASGCVSQATPTSTAATRMLSPLSGGAVTSDFRPSPSERAQAVLARVSRQDQGSPVQVPQPSNNASLTEQPSLMPMASMLGSASLAPQASTDEVRHAPSSVMCSQVWTSLTANLSDHGRPETLVVNKTATTFGRNMKGSPQSKHGQSNRPSSGRSRHQSLPYRQPWPLDKKSDERHIFKQFEELEEADAVRTSMSCSPKKAQETSAEERSATLGTGEGESQNTNVTELPAQHASGEALLDTSAAGKDTCVSDTSSQSHTQQGLHSLQQDMTVFSKSCSMESSSQNENAGLEYQEPSRSSAEFRKVAARPPLKESSDNFDHPPLLQKARSRTNAAIMEAAFEGSSKPLHPAGSLHNRTRKHSPKRRQSMVGKRPSTTETRPSTRDTKWTPRSQITPSPAKIRPAVHSSGKSSSEKKRNEWKVPNRSRSMLANARTFPHQDLKPSGDFYIGASTGSQ